MVSISENQNNFANQMWPLTLPTCYKYEDFITIRSDIVTITICFQHGESLWPEKMRFSIFV